jgi:hypothetical protein
MSNRRRLRPHEVARHDQRLAEVQDMLRRGEPTIWVDPAPPGTACCYCDCPITPGSPHGPPGYACADLCPAGAVYLVLAVNIPQVAALPLCARHYRDWCADFTELTRPVAVKFMEWAGGDYGKPA